MAMRTQAIWQLDAKASENFSLGWREALSKQELADSGCDVTESAAKNREI
jgi:hypothetical protein